MRTLPPWWSWVLLAALVVWVAADTRAHDGYDTWFQPQTGKSCCSESDCRPTAAWQDMNGTWWVRVRGRPVPVPGNRIVRKATDGRCHVCESNGEIHCFNGCDPKF